MSFANKADSNAPSTERSRHLRSGVVEVAGRIAQRNPRVDVFAVAIVRASNFVLSCRRISLPELTGATVAGEGLGRHTMISRCWSTGGVSGFGGAAS
jgi:hypothetical protein